MAGRIFISYRRADTANQVDYTDRDNPYTRGYMGLYVESISDSPSTAAAEFDNFTAARS